MAEHDPMVCGLHSPEDSGAPLCPGCLAEWKPGYAQCLSCGAWLRLSGRSYCPNCLKLPKVRALLERGSGEIIGGTKVRTQPRRLEREAGEEG